MTNTAALGYLSIIIFNFTGFEVICTFAKDMQNPARDIPKAIILGGLAIGAIYLFCGFGIGAVINSIISFIITAFVVFLLVKGVNKLTHLKKQEEQAQEPEEPAGPTTEELLTEIRDLLKEQK